MTEDAALRLVHATPSSSRASERLFSRRWQYAGHVASSPSPAPTSRARRRRTARGRARPGGAAARLRERLPPPRRRGGLGRRAAARRCSATTTRGPTASTGRCARRRAPTPTRASTAAELGLRRRSVDTWGPFVFVNADADAPPLADTLGALPRAGARAGGARRRLAALPLARALLARRELEGRGRELPRVLPLRGRSPELQRRVDVRPDALRLETHPSFATHYARLRGARTARGGRGPVPPRSGRTSRST